MAKNNIHKTELFWPGKYDENGQLKKVERVNLPFQVIESINETRATREAKKEQHPSLFDMWEAKEGETFEEGWKNKLIWGENKYVISSLLNNFAGKIDLIYIDPPFATGADFNFKTQVGEGKTEIYKEQSILEEKVYRDTWGKGQASYLNMISDRLVLMRELLSDQGGIYVHVDYRLSSVVRLVMEEIFGPNNFQNEIIWCYVGGRVPKVAFGRRHDTILFFTKSDKWTFNWKDVMEPLSEKAPSKYRYEDEIGRYRLMGRCLKGSPIRAARDVSPEWEEKHPELVYRYYMKDGTLCLDYWNIPPINQASKERTGFPTQKPVELLERIILASSNKGDLVADFFCGSGTTCVAAEQLDRRWIGCDLSRWAINISRKRLLEIENCNPFEVLNLGKYERKYWQGVTFGGKKKDDQQIAIFEYLKFILRLNGAEPISGMEHLHGKKGNAVIHVGAVDAPVTIDEINACIDECIAIKQRELHILGWEWEMGLYELMPKASEGRGVKLVLFQIPREVMEQQAVDKGDIQFFELAYLSVGIKKSEGRKAQVELKDFVIPNTELIPEDVRKKIDIWSDYIDYWAIDWDFQNDTFMQGWVDYRTRKNRKLSLKSDVHKYEREDNYTIMVKVIDVFGNDTSQTYEIGVK